MTEHVVETERALEQIVEALLGERRVGLDAEGDGLYRYRSRLCVVQLAGEDGEAIIDPLAFADLRALGRLTGSEGPELVVHDVSFDVKMLDTRGVRLERVFDTAVAARFLGEANTGLSALLEKHLEIAVDKSHQQDDWGQRPITDAQRDYLIGDVRHLPALADQLEEAARAIEILEEINEETNYALARALEPEAVIEPWTRIKGSGELGPMGTSVLKSLADARERLAIEEDVPPFRIAHNRALLEAVGRRPANLADLRKVRGLKKMEDAPLTSAIEEAYARGPLERSPVAVPPPEERRQRKAREKALTAWRKTEAERRKVDVQVVLPGHCLRDLGAHRVIDDLATIQGFGAKRIAIYGPALLAVLAKADGE